MRITAIAALLLAVCAYGCRVVDQSDMRAIAERIRQSDSPLLDHVVFKPADILDDPYVAVFLHAGTTEDEARAFWCEVVVPAGGTGQSIEKTTVSVWEAGTDDLLLPRDGVPCSRASVAG